MLLNYEKPLLRMGPSLQWKLSFNWNFITIFCSLKDEEDALRKLPLGFEKIFRQSTLYISGSASVQRERDREMDAKIGMTSQTMWQTFSIPSSSWWGIYKIQNLKLPPTVSGQHNEVSCVNNKIKIPQRPEEANYLMWSLLQGALVARHDLLAFLPLPTQPWASTQRPSNLLLSSLTDHLWM